MQDCKKVTHLSGHAHERLEHQRYHVEAGRHHWPAAPNGKEGETRRGGGWRSVCKRGDKDRKKIWQDERIIRSNRRFKRARR